MYAVWFNMYPNDEKDRWPAAVLHDARVTHFWDEQKAVGRWYFERIGEMDPTRAPDSVELEGSVLWAAYLVYGPESRWDAAPTGLRRWGRTVLSTQEAFRESFNLLVHPRASK